MIVIELEEKRYGKTMEAVSKIKEYAECLAEMFEDSSKGRASHRAMRYDKDYDDEEEYEDVRIKHRGGYGNRYM